MDEKDAKIRKQWLWVFSLNLVQSAVCCILTLFFSNPELVGVDYNPYLGAIVSFVSMLGMSFAMYWCIYKKPGTKLVTVLLFIAILGLFVTPYFLITGKLKHFYSIPYQEALLTFSYVLGLFWIAVCWRIRKVNRKLQTIPTDSNSP